jgi:hypothetical protein
VRKAILVPPSNSRKPAKKYKTARDEHIAVQVNYFLETFKMCQELHVLPRGGGLYDQDSYFVHVMKHALNAQNERAELDRHKASAKMKK